MTIAERKSWTGAIVLIMPAVKFGQHRSLETVITRWRFFEGILGSLDSTKNA
jgi:hypothetical protein